MQLYKWFPAIHIVGVVLWLGGLTAVLALLHVHPRVETGSRQLLSSAERKLALMMDLGATLTIAVGLWFAIDTNQFKNGGWLHIKLTAVVVCILSVHGFARVKIKKYRTGDARPVPPTLWLLLAAGALTAAILGGNQYLMRG
jgi:uncharacterized membrane protein